MTAPVEPDLDLSDLLRPVPVPPDGAGRAERTARRRRSLRRVGAATVSVVLVFSAFMVVRAGNRGDRTVQTAGEGVTPALLSTLDVQRVLPDMILMRAHDGGDTGHLLGPELQSASPAAQSGITRQWTFHGEHSVGAPMPDRIETVIASILRFRDGASATAFLNDLTAGMQRSGAQPSQFTSIPGATEVRSAGSGGGESGMVFFPRDRFLTWSRPSGRWPASR